MATGTIPKYMDGTDSGWLEYTNPSKFSGIFYYRKIGNLLVISSNWIKLAENLSAKSNINLADGKPFPVPPSRSFALMGFINTGLVSNRYLPLRLSDEGTMYIYSATDAVDMNYGLFFSGMGV